MADFKSELFQESDFPMSDILFDMIMDVGHEKVFARGESIIRAGSTVPDVFIIYDGVVKGFLNLNGVEKILYFGSCGTLLTTMHSFSCSQPSVIDVEACTKVTAICVLKQDFDHLMDTSIEFCKWIAGIFSRRCYYQEVKAKIMCGDSKWRYRWIQKCRPELLQNVPQKSIASYLGITEQHLSRIRRSLHIL